jgi:hypothetical protein
MNVFVFSSLALALICAFVGILRKNQLKQHLFWTKTRTDARSQIADRQFSFELNSSLKLWDSARHFSLGLALSIGLFAIGVFVFLWTLDPFLVLAVFLFSLLTLCVIFWRVVSYYYRRCRSWICAIRRSLWKSLPKCLRPRDWGLRLLSMGGGVYTGSQPLVKDHFDLLLRAIMSRTSGLNPSGVDPHIQRLAQCIEGLGRLPDDTYVWRVLTPTKMKDAVLESAGLGRALEIVLGILKERDPLKGRRTIPLSLWSRIRGCLTGCVKPYPQQRQLPLYGNIPDSIVLEYPWLIWTETALRQFNTEEQCLLGDIVSEQLEYTLRVTEPLRGSDIDMNVIPDELLHSAFCLAHVLLAHIPCGPSYMNLRQAIALAGVRLQFSSLPSGPCFVSTSNLDYSDSTHQAPHFVEWPNQSLQQGTNEMMPSCDFWDLFGDNLHCLSHESAGQHQFPPASVFEFHFFAEYAVDTFLQAALSIDLTSGLSKLSPMLWARSSQGLLFSTASAHALSILRMWHLESPASVDARRPEITRLCLRLTELLRHDLLSLLRTGKPFSVSRLASSRFPWHGCLKGFVDCFPTDSEMGALLRYLVRKVSNDSWLSIRRLDTLAALFPPSSEADHNVQVTITQYLASLSNLVLQSCPEGTTTLPEVASPCADAAARNSSNITVGFGCAHALVATTENSLRQLGLPDPGVGHEIDQRAAVHASDPGQAMGALVSSPHCTVDIDPVIRSRFAAPCNSGGPTVSTAESAYGGVGSELGQSCAGREVPGFDERGPHLAIDMQPAARLASRIEPSSEANHEVGGIE